MGRILALLLCLAAFPPQARAEPLDPAAARRIAQGAVAEILEALARGDFGTLASFVGSAGLIVSPYVMIDDGDPRLSRVQVESCASDPLVRLWGFKDGSGDPIEATCSDYFRHFVWDADYRTADEVLYNEPRQRGNDINNDHRFAADGIVVELHIRGAGTQAAMNWKSLRLIFRLGEKELSLIAITRDVWTI